MTSGRPSLPLADQWRRWRIDVLAEFDAGKQSRVFDALLEGRRTVVKLTESRLADFDVLTARMHAVETLATAHPAVVAPTRIDGALVRSIGDWFVTATPFIAGEAVDDDINGAERLGFALGELHLAMRCLEEVEIPSVAALRSSAREEEADWQLLHGDFSTKNVIATRHALRVFDFDDCGYGPTRYDVANSLYMVSFDAHITNRPERYDAFRPAFLAGYASSSNRVISDRAIDEMIARRIGALGRWLSDLSTAPIGIRTSSPAWRRVLATFVARH